MEVNFFVGDNPVKDFDFLLKRQNTSVKKVLKKNPKLLKREVFKERKRKNFSSLQDGFSGGTQFTSEKVYIEKKNNNEAVKGIFSTDSFSNFNLSPRLLSVLKELNFLTPTRIQSLVIPVLLRGRDCLIQSQTGSGKTLSYLLPMIHNLQDFNPRLTRKDGLAAIIISPTRELTLQIFTVLTKLLKRCHWIVPGHVSGGDKKKSEKARIRKDIDLIIYINHFFDCLNIIVATPGRFVDHLRTTSVLNISKVKWLILDEADRLLDMNFEKDIATIVNILNDQKEQNISRRNVLCSATLNHDIRRLAKLSLENPEECFADVHETLKGRELSASSLSTIRNNKDIVDFEQKLVIPSQLKQGFASVAVKSRLGNVVEKGKILVFLNTCDMVDFYYSLFRSEPFCKNAHFSDFVCARLHGDMPQQDRLETFKKFISCQSGLLLCTDVAARGLDLSKVDWIVQYNLPMDFSDYVHRVGRTARIGACGKAIMFLSDKEHEFITIIESSHGIKLENFTLRVTESFKVIFQRFYFGKRKLCREEAAAFLQKLFEDTVESDVELKSLAEKAFQSFVCSYAAYPKSMKACVHVKNLHLGHVAKSFALRDSPAALSKRQCSLNNTKSRPSRSFTPTLKKLKNVNNKPEFCRSTTVFGGIRKVSHKPKLLNIDQKSLVYSRRVIGPQF